MRKCEECQVLWRGTGPCWACGGPGRATWGMGPLYSNAYEYRAGDEVVT